METVVEGQNQPKIATKRTNIFQKIVKKKKKKKGEEDRISALPDCLLVEVLSRLPSTEEAVRTGTLSKRWKHLWTSVPTLIFSFIDFNHPLSDFISFVNKTLTQCGQSKLKKFELYTNSDIQFESQFNRWIRYAISCNVEELILLLCCMRMETEFHLDQVFYTSLCFTDLTLVNFVLDPTGAVSWKNLRSLSISYVKLDGDLIEKILSGSPVLENLALDCCYGYKMLGITSKNVKNLSLRYVGDPDDIFEINAPDILSLTISGILVLWKILLLNVSSLVEVNLDYQKYGHSDTTFQEAEEETLKGFLLNLRHVKELKLGASCSKVLSRLEAKGFSV